MLVRILDEGQYRLAEEHRATLDAFDTRLAAALADGDRRQFAADYALLLDFVRRRGSRLGDGDLAHSVVVLPPVDASFEEVRRMIGTQGFAPR